MKKLTILCFLIPYLSIFYYSLQASEDMTIKNTASEQAQGPTFFPNGYAFMEIFGEYENKYGKKFEKNTSYQNRLYFGSQFNNGRLDVKALFTFKKPPQTREVKLEDTILMSSFKFIESQSVLLKAGLWNSFPTGDGSLRTKTVVSASLNLLTKMATDFGVFIPGFGLSASDEIYESKKFTKKTNEGEKFALVRGDPSAEWVEVDHPVDLDLETGIILDYLHPNLTSLFIEINFFDQRQWYSNGQYKRGYYSEGYIKYNVSPSVYLYNYTKVVFDENLKLATDDENQGAVLTRVALGYLF